MIILFSGLAEGAKKNRKRNFERKKKKAKGPEGLPPQKPPLLLGHLIPERVCKGERKIAKKNERGMQRLGKR